MLVVFPIAIVSSFLGPEKGGNIVFKLCTIWADIWYFLIFIRHKNIYEEPLRKGQSYVFVANHISYLDATLIPKSIRQPVRALGKIEIANIPVFGFIYKNAIITIDRSSAEHRARSVFKLKTILSKGISIFVFPEGTFNQSSKPLKEFYDGAFRIAIEANIPIRPVLYLDTFNRIHPKSIFSLNPGINRAIFLEEISVHGLTIKDIKTLKDKVYSVMEAKLIQYKAPWILETAIP
jgi:1-acyl-sn-glycerol-3-phosphate acyltransferase